MSRVRPRGRQGWRPGLVKCPCGWETAVRVSRLADDGEAKVLVVHDVIRGAVSLVIRGPADSLWAGVRVRCPECYADVRVTYVTGGS